MKRSKKRNKAAFGQLCLFDLPGIRQQEEEETRRTKTQRKPAAPSKFAALTLMPPAPEPALKQPENALQTEIPDREELNRLWKANPGALHTLNRMKEINPHVITLVRRLALVPLCLLFLLACQPPSGSVVEAKADADAQSPTAPASPIEQAVSLLAVLEGWHDPQKTGCTGWGHRICYDDARASTPVEADSLAAADLRALCARFRDFQGDSLLLALLAYNVGVKAVKTSSLMDFLTFEAYTSFCYIKGKRSERQYQRRREEWMLFKTP